MDYPFPVPFDLLTRPNPQTQPHSRPHLYDEAATYNS